MELSLDDWQLIRARTRTLASQLGEIIKSLEGRTDPDVMAKLKANHNRAIALQGILESYLGLEATDGA